CHVYPPLRSMKDKEGLLAGLQDGTLDAICSDHRPLDGVAKLAPFAESEPGMSSIDTFVGLGLRLVNEYGLELHTLLRAITYQPAHILHLPVGTLSIGARADICIIDPDRTQRINDLALQSGGKNTPFKGWELVGQAVMTLINGTVVHEI
ncbi:MAG TPA: amidohydrolase family protein, partial [Candidatus Berkiella sp.]|nr:amidohydrolase family protein [Candidatus Berkiella sp.]